MKFHLFISLLTILVFSQGPLACQRNKGTTGISSTVKAKDLVNVAVGDRAKAVTRIGAIGSKTSKKRQTDVKVGRVIQINSGANAISCLQLPSDGLNCD